MPLRCEIVTQDRRLFEGPADMVVAPGSEGDFGVLPGHINFLTALRPGTLTYRIGESAHRLELPGGIAEVLNNRVTILASSRASTATGAAGS